MSQPIKTQEKGKGVFKITLTGEFDSYDLEHVALLKQELERIMQGNNLKIAVDLKDFKWISSSVVNILQQAQIKAIQQVSEIKIINANDTIQSILDLIGLNHLIGIQDWTQA